MKQRSPFKFLDAYSQADEAIFFGREKETEDLYEALSGVKHLLVYGPSGAGKTSLIECGLRNQFSDADWFALSIRRGDNINTAVFARINEALEEKIKINSKTQLPKNESIQFEQAIEKLFEERFQPVYLLFDQFEELLILGNEKEKNSFFRALDKLIRYKIPCRILLIMREEFIGHLSEFESLCPSIFKHRFRLEKMRKDKVGEVIEQMLEVPAYQEFYTLNNSKALANKILQNLPDEKREIELTHVQVFLSELWGRAKKENIGNEKPVLDSNLVNEDDNLEGVLNSFLKKQLQVLDKKYGESHALEVLESMISERHTKLQLSKKAIANDLKDKEVKVELYELLQDLEQNRLIRSQKAGEQTEYEVSHDLLALAVGQNLTEAMQMRRKTEEVYKVYEERQGYLSSDDLDFLRPYKPYKDYPEQLSQKIRRSEIFIKKEQEQKLIKAEERAAKEKQLRDKAEKNAQKAKQRTLIASIITFLAVATSILAFTFFKNAEQQTLLKGEALINVEKEQQKNKKIIDAFYFYKDKFALAYKDKKYGFINKDGEVVIGYKYEHAEHFNYAGYAKVRKKEIDEQINYFIDTNGREIRVAYEIADLNTDIEALDLREKKMETFPGKILKNKQLKVLMLSESHITLPESIGNLQKLESLYLNGNQLRELPASIGNFQKLKSLYLFNNQLYTLPASISNLQNLTKLSLSANLLSELPTSIGELQNLTSLYLNVNQLSELPASIGNLKNLTSLSLSYNQLYTLPAEIGQLGNLTRLYLERSELYTLPTEIGQLKNLTELDLKYNEFSTLPVEIGQLKNLVWLDLSYNQLNSIPTEIGQLKNLATLDLSGNEFNTLPSAIGQLQNMFWLSLNENKLKNLSEEIGQLNNLTELDLSDNELNTLPEEISQLKNLIKLDLSYNELNNLPKEIGQLKSLISLDISENELNILPTEITQLKNLKWLDLSDNELNTLEVGQLENLSVLDLSRNNFNTLPTKVMQLRNLTWLNLSYNQLNTIPEGIGKLENLTELYLSGNEFKTIPEEIWQLKNLTKLDLRKFGSKSRRNEYKPLPEAIKQLENLMELYLKGNEFSTLPKEIGQLVNLTTLDLCRNEFTTLPEEIGQLENLSLLDLSENQFSTIPEEIGQLKNLTTLVSSYNQLETLPKEIGQLKNLTELNLSNNYFKILPTEIGQLEYLTKLDLGYNYFKILPKEIGQLKNLTALSVKGNDIQEEDIKQLQKQFPSCEIVW